MTTDPTLRPSTIAALNHLLTHELMAAEACRGAALSLGQLPVVAVLRQVMEGHHLRAGVLYEAIRSRVEQPAADPARQVPVFPPAAEPRAVLAHLLDLEQRGVAAYRQSLNQLDPGIRTMVEADLLSAQETSLATIAGAQPPAADGAV
jgi:hypothetical protein